MPTNEEKVAFSRRLDFALHRSPEPIKGATELALRFNLRHKGNAISPQTAHKWLTGRAIPTSDKLETLADWLNVEVHWLHYGPSPAKPTLAEDDRIAKGVSKPSPETVKLALKIHGLPPMGRYLVEELVEQLRRTDSNSL
jgi:transcriptional regulator with XRE-family HTH domain